ncbi:STAS domain-containing protein [Sphingobacterium sp. Mn56C]|uniref:STAS domain-containing protein n=1 Tax=Sphingobacterium sp. Mn56C TaxID=3395261 RepID=UPI003BC5AC38
MRFTIDKHERYVVIEPLCAHLDGHAAAYLKAEFMLRNTSGQRNIVLDFSNIEKIDEEGIRMGLLAHRLCHAAGGMFIVTHLNAELLQWIKLAQLDTYFVIVKGIPEAEDLIFGHELQHDLRGDL